MFFEYHAEHHGTETMSQVSVHSFDLAIVIKELGVGLQ
jgi:hypothetical protein